MLTIFINLHFVAKFGLLLDTDTMLQLFVAEVYNTLNVEENIYRENNTINKFMDK